MKLFLNNKTPVLTKEIEPSWHCSEICCFYALAYTPLSCNLSFHIKCTEKYSYTLQDNISDIFKL